MSKPVGTIEHTRGATINFGIRTLSTLPLGEVDIPENYVETPYDGTEIVTCNVKLATNKDRVPNIDEDSIFSIASVFVAADGDNSAYWLFTITPIQSLLLIPNTYVIDAKILYTSGVIDYPAPILLQICEHVTS